MRLNSQNKPLVTACTDSGHNCYEIEHVSRGNWSIYRLERVSLSNGIYYKAHYITQAVNERSARELARKLLTNDNEVFTCWTSSVKALYE